MIQRSKGNTRISSMPYSIVTTTVNSAMLRLGSNVPVPNGQNSFNYQLVGTRIDTNMALTSDGRYNLYLSLDDSSVADTETGGATRSAMPILRSYAIETRLILRDGQSVEVNVGTDKVSGETVTALVMVTALKP